MRVYPIHFNDEKLTLYHNSEEWVLCSNDNKIITWSSEAGTLFDLYGKEAATRLYGEIVTITEFGKGDQIDDQKIPPDVQHLAKNFSD